VPVVYRSLPVAATAVNPIATGPIVVKQQAGTESSSSTTSSNAEDPTSIPFPPVPVASLQNGAIWKDQVNLTEIEKMLSSTCSACKLERTSSSCEFRCKATAEDGNEECDFTLNLWAVPEGEEGAMGKYLIQVDRSAGCPYVFKNVIAKTFNVPINQGPHSFRVPQLPACVCDQGKGIRFECVERAIALATSDAFEQRVQGANVLADLCSMNNPVFVSMFKAANGPARMGPLLEDSDAGVRRAAAKVLSHCSA